MADVVESYEHVEIQKLRTEVEQEKEMKQMLQQSTDELKATISELESRFEDIDEEGSEWKTRYETQQEMNSQLERQVILLQSKLEEARINLCHANKTTDENAVFGDMSDANPQLIKALEREKQLLINQLEDLHWRLDQESKAYYKANDERKQYMLEMGYARNRVNDSRDKLPATGRNFGDSPVSSRQLRDGGGNIPVHQRIIEPKKGPIRKAAAVKNLPTLENV